MPIQITPDLIIDRDPMNWTLMQKIMNTRSTAKHESRWESLGFYATLSGALRAAFHLQPELTLLCQKEQVTLGDMAKLVDEWAQAIYLIAKSTGENVSTDQATDQTEVK